MMIFDRVVKTVFYILNAFSMLICIGLIGSGFIMVRALMTPNLQPLDYLIMFLEAVLFFMGAFLTLAFCVFAFVAERTRARMLLVSYAITVFLIAVLELTIGIYFYTHLAEIDAKVKVELNITMYAYGYSPRATEFLDYMQGAYGCCGVDSASDWKDTPYYKENHVLPESCCTPLRARPTATCQIGGSSVHNESCYQFTHWFVTFHYEMLSSLFFVAGTVQVLCVGMVLWMLFYTTKQVSKPEDSELKAEKPLKALGIDLDIPSSSYNDEPKEHKVV